MNIKNLSFIVVLGFLTTPIFSMSDEQIRKEINIIKNLHILELSVIGEICFPKNRYVSEDSQKFIEYSLKKIYHNLSSRNEIISDLKKNVARTCIEYAAEYYMNPENIIRPGILSRFNKHPNFLKTYYELPEEFREMVDHFADDTVGMSHLGANN